MPRSQPPGPDYDALRSAYTDPARGLQSAEQLKRKLGNQYTLKAIKEWIAQQNVQQRFYERRRPKPFFAMSRGQIPYARAQIDLLDVTSLNPNKNQGTHFLMLCIDAYSKYLTCVAIKTKSTDDVLPALKQTLEEICAVNSFAPQVLDSDNEGAFLSLPVRAELKEDDVQQNIVKSGDHLALSYINRVCRTMRTLIYKYREMTNSSDYMSGLPHLVQNYNTSWNRAIGCTPEEALKQQTQTDYVKNKTETQNTRAAKQGWNKADINVGSSVRVALSPKLFDKLTKARWSDKVYEVDRTIGNVFFYVHGLSQRFRKYQLQLVADAPDSDSDSDGMERKYPVDDVPDGVQDDDYAAQRLQERRLAREGLD
jgi:hypothetical protein